MKSLRRTARELAGKTGPTCISLRVVEKTNVPKSPNESALDYQIYKLENEEGSIVQVVLYEPCLEFFEDIMEYDMAYEISNAQVRLMPAHEWEHSNKEMYDLIFTGNTSVLPISHMKTFQKLEYTLIGAIPRTVELEGRYDVLGVVVYVDETIQILKQDGQSKNLCEILIVDQSSEQTMIVTVWEDFLIEHCRKLQTVAASFPVISFSALRTSFQKGFSLSTTRLTCIAVDPQGTEADTLRAWRDSNEVLLAAKSRQVFQARQPDTNRAITTIATLRAKKVSNTLQEERHWLYVRLPEFIQTDLELYLGCSNCGIGTYEDIGTTYTCNACHEEEVIPSPKMAFQFAAVDETGSYFFTAKFRNAEMILQISAPRLYYMSPQEREEYLVTMENKLKETQIYIQVEPDKSLSRTQHLKWVLQRVCQNYLEELGPR